MPSIIKDLTIAALSQTVVTDVPKTGACGADPALRSALQASAFETDLDPAASQDTTFPQDEPSPKSEIPVMTPPPPGLPSHVALIMDGNGRWAAARGLPRIEGHRRGLEALRRAVRTAAEFKLAYLTVYSFSAENWNRPFDEVQDLMGLLKRFIRKDLVDLHKSGIRVRVIGHRDNLQPDIRGLLEEAEAMTRLNQGLTLVVAFNYGGRQEIASAVREIARKLAQGLVVESEINEKMLSEHLDTSDIPDPDLIIRTSGEQRLSNFLLWQAAYSEFVFLPVLWPDFDRNAFSSALSEYAARDRRFGGLSGPHGVAARTGS